MENQKQLIKPKNRVIYFDILRILATIAVITIHVSAQSWYTTSPSSYEWNIFNLYNSIVRWAVPIFIMISGAIFLDNNKEINIKKLYTKNIFRIVTAFAFWSLIYAIDTYDFSEGTNGGISFFEKVILGNYHMWFLYMIIGLYIITPILRKITIDKKTTEYFLVISIIFTFIIPYLFKMQILSDTSTILNHINLNFAYATYFVLGYYLNTKEISAKKRKVIYSISILGFLITILVSTIVANYKMKPFGIYNALYPNVLLQAIGVFLFVKNIKFNIKEKQDKWINLLSKYSFGIYLVHDLIINKLAEIGINTLSFNAIISVPIIVVMTFIISLIISAIINNIPILKKYIV